MKISKGWLLIILSIILIIIDQALKFWVKTDMYLGQSINIFGTWFQLSFVENKGMAYGLHFGGDIGKYILTIFRIIVFIVLVYWIRGAYKKGYKTSEGNYVRVPYIILVALTLIAAGALGNIIDCIFYGQIFSASSPSQLAHFGGSYAPFLLGKVVDMLHFPMIDTILPNWVPFWGGQQFVFFEPVFNIADSCVSVGATILAISYVIWFLKNKREQGRKVV